MKQPSIESKIKAYIKVLCVDTDNRPPGSPGNKKAVEFFARTVKSFGFDTRTPEFSCIDWEHGEVRLEAGGKQFAAFVGPYSLGCNTESELIIVSTIKELERKDITGKFVLLHDEIASEQLMPKNFEFYNPDHHKKIYSLLEKKKPLAVICSTKKNPAQVGALYPFPMFEDGDFDIPSVYMKHTEGVKLFRHVGEKIHLSFESRRIPSKGANVVARKKGSIPKRIVIFAHIDTRKSTPGALDNTSGTVTLLTLAELLSDYRGKPTIELVAMNGEDYYSNPGEMLWLKENRENISNIILGINIDDVGFIKGKEAFSLYECPEPVSNIVKDFIDNNDDLVEGEPWFQGDHMLFVMNCRPAVAVTSDKGTWLMKNVTHTEKDTVDLVDTRKIAGLAASLKDIVLRVGESM